MLSVSRLVNVTLNLSPLAAQGRNFGTLMVAGDSNVINAAQRFRTYVSLDGVEADFGADAPETQAAELYFGQTPQPSTLMIGRWLRTASAGENIGGILNPSQQALSNFTSITNGGLVIVIDGSTKTLTGLNFSSQTNLNGVAGVITTALSGSGTCIWDGEEFSIVSATTGAGTQASGTVTFTAAPSPSDTLTLNGQLLTFVASLPGANEILIGADEVQSAANLQAFLNTSVDPDLLPASYATANGVTTITFNAIGTSGNAYTLTKSSTAISLSASTLLGGVVPSSVGYATTGSGTDVSALFQLTASLSQALVAGASAESPLQCATILAAMSPNWYGLMFNASVQPTDDQNIAVAGFIEGTSLSRTFGVTIQNTNVLSSIVTSDLASRLKAAGYLQSFCQYSSSSQAAVASFFGRAFSVDFTQNNSTITLMYKQEPGVTGENLTEEQAEVLESKRCNVFVDYVNDTMIIEDGVMSGPAYFDEIQGLDWLQNAIQTNCFNVLYQSTTKVPQTDAGVNQLVNAISAACNKGVNNGLIAPGIWQAAGFGQLETGDFLKTGFYIYAQPIALQSQSDRDARIAPPIQVAVKLAGAIQTMSVQINVNR